MSAPTVQALVPADHVYRDQASGKYVIAGTFHQINVEAFPTTLSRTVGLFVSLRGVEAETGLELQFLDPETGDALISSNELSIVPGDPELPVEFAVELPPLPLPRAGRYVLRLAVGGTPVGEAPVVVRGPA